MTRKRKPAGVTPSPLFSWLSGAVASAIFSGKRFSKAISVRARPFIPKKLDINTIPDRTVPKYCCCANFKAADLRWRAMTKAEQKVWNDAVKAPHMVGYQVFMNENCHCLYNYAKWTDIPSVSGGFSCRNIVPGPASDEDWIGLYPQSRFSCVASHFEWYCSLEPLWECHQALVHECRPSKRGKYVTLNQCLYWCTDPAGFPSQIDCLEWCIPPRWHCTGTPDYDCIEVEYGEYMYIEACQTYCVPPPWACTGYPTYQCIESELGEYPTLDDCIDACIPPAYSCTGTPDWLCVPDPDGIYPDLESCYGDCIPPPEVPGYYCVWLEHYPGTMWEPNPDCQGEPSYSLDMCAYLDEWFFIDCGWDVCCPGWWEPFTSSKLHYVAGPFETVTLCSEGCAQPPFRCTGAPYYRCTHDPAGEYPTLDQCLAACHA